MLASPQLIDFGTRTLGSKVTGILNGSVWSDSYAIAFSQPASRSVAWNTPHCALPGLMPPWRRARGRDKVFEADDANGIRPPSYWRPWRRPPRASSRTLGAEDARLASDTPQTRFTVTSLRAIGSIAGSHLVPCKLNAQPPRRRFRYIAPSRFALLGPPVPSCGASGCDFHPTACARVF